MNSPSPSQLLSHWSVLCALFLPLLLSFSLTDLCSLSPSPSQLLSHWSVICALFLPLLLSFSLTDLWSVLSFSLSFSASLSLICALCSLSPSPSQLLSRWSVLSFSLSFSASLSLICALFLPPKSLSFFSFLSFSFLLAPSSHLPLQPLTPSSHSPPASVSLSLSLSLSNTHAHTHMHRLVRVARGGGGFGFSLSGNAPVFIRSVDPSGAATSAGLRAGDRLLALNGLNIRWADISSGEQIFHQVSRYFIRWADISSGEQRFGMCLVGECPRIPSLGYHLLLSLTLFYSSQ